MLCNNIPPDFRDRLAGKDYCRWCFSQQVTHVTDENQLTVLTALAKSHDINDSNEINYSNYSDENDDLKGCDTDSPPIVCVTPTAVRHSGHPFRFAVSDVC